MTVRFHEVLLLPRPDLVRYIDSLSPPVSRDDLELVDVLRDVEPSCEVQAAVHRLRERLLEQISKQVDGFPPTLLVEPGAPEDGGNRPADVLSWIESW